LKKKKISITVHDGAPMDLTVLRNGRVQRLRSLEEAEARYLESLRKARPDLADKVHYAQKRESCPPRKEWRPKSTRADVDTHMVFVLPIEFHARAHEELSVAQLDLGPRPVIFEKPQAKNYKHLKALYLKTNVMLSDFNGQTSEAQGVLSVDLTVKNKTVPTSFFIINSKSTYNVLLGRDWIHTNCCIPSIMHQCLIQ
jgi:hypothetical protein